MNRVALLLRTPAVALYDFDHPHGDVHADPDHERSPNDSISFVEHGAFDACVGGERWRIGAGDLFVTRRGMEFSCCHDDDMPTDRCLTISYADEAVEDLMRLDMPELRPPVARMSARRQYLRHRLESCGPGEELRFELIAGALYESLATNRPSAPARLDAATTPLMRRIDRAVQLVETGFSRPLTLADLASAAGLSPFYFARAFRRFVGVPPHRYLTAVRLRHAARLLDEGATVTFTCYEVGFGSLSHFVTAFRKRFGVVPSAARGAVNARALRSATSGALWTRAGKESKAIRLVAR
jgi:AraC family transcriptional regulator